MKRLAMATALLLSAPAMAALLPSTLPDGQYKMQCTLVNAYRLDAPTDGSAAPVPFGTDSSGITRENYSTSGTSLSVTTGNETTVKEVYTSKASAGWSTEGQNTYQSTFQ